MASPLVVGTKSIWLFFKLKHRSHSGVGKDINPSWASMHVCLRHDFQSPSRRDAFAIIILNIRPDQLPRLAFLRCYLKCGRELRPQPCQALPGTPRGSTKISLGIFAQYPQQSTSLPPPAREVTPIFCRTCPKQAENNRMNIFYNSEKSPRNAP